MAYFAAVENGTGVFFRVITDEDVIPENHTIYQQPADYVPQATDTWDPDTHLMVHAAPPPPPPPDPALGGQDDWYVYVDPDGVIQSGGNDPDAPSGLASVRLDAIPDGTEDWDPGSRRFAVEQSVPALLLRTMLPTLLRRLETVETLQDRLAELGLPADTASAVQGDLADRRGRLLGLIALALGDYAQAMA